LTLDFVLYFKDTLKVLKLLPLLLLISCVQKTPEDKVIIHELPITSHDGVGDFYKRFGIISTKPSPNSFWSETRVDVEGIPDSWKEPVIKQIWFDAHQFAYQNYKAGNIDSARFEDLKSSWNFDPEMDDLTEQAIKSFTHIVITKDESGNLSYRIDTDNDLSFEDEKTFSSVNETGLKNSSDSKVHTLNYQSLRNDSVTDLKTKLEIRFNKFGLMNYHPVYYTAQFQDSTIQISNGFQSTEFRSATSLLIGKRDSLHPQQPIELNEYLRLNDRTFQNLGVDANKMVLRLKELPEDTVLFSTQIGFPAKPITGNEFTSRQEISLNDYIGKFVFLDFWGSWCAPCIDELPMHVETYNAIDKSKIDFLGVAGSDTEEGLSKTLKEFNVQWNQILSNEIPNQYGITGYPTSYLIDPDGIIVAKNLRGPNFPDTLDHYLKNYFGN
jgi:thiol-disulfide isomerase/thioredoxin